MHHLKKTCLAWVIVALLLAQPTRAATPRAFRCGGWNIVPSPNPTSYLNVLNGITALSATDAWAVGYDFVSNGLLQTVTEHWNGTSWQVVPSPSESNSDLFGITALAPNNIWAVGYGDSEFQNLIEHWDGTTWSIIKIPKVGGYLTGLSSVSAVSPTDIWAVGTYALGSGQPIRTLIEHWDGSQWSIVKSLNVGSHNTYLERVVALSSSNVWAVGTYSVGRYGAAPLIEHWNGTQWSRMHVSGNLVSGFGAVTALQANDVWAVGSYGSGTTAIDHWDGQHWHHVPSPNPQDGVAYSLSSVSAASATDAWTVSSYTNFSHNLNLAQTLTERWDGTQWSIVPSPNMQDAAGQTSLDNFLTGVAMAPATHTAWAVGYYGPHDGSTDKTLIEYYC